MRRALPLVLLTLGVFSITLGMLMRFYAYPRLALAPLDPQVVSVAKGTATVFYPATLQVREKVPVTTTIRVQGQIDAPEVTVNGSVAVWDAGQVTEDDNGALVDAIEQWVCVDRRGAVAVAPCSEQKINGDAGAPMSGLQFKFPFNTGQRDYLYYDSTARQALPMRYDGQDAVDGLPVYRFVQTVPVMKIAEVDAPASLVGGTSNDTVKASRMYENKRTYWVEPYTGEIVKGQEHVHQFLRGPDGQDGQVLFDGTLTVTDDVAQATVVKAAADRGKVRLLYDSGPRLLVGLGVVQLLGGLLLLAAAARRRRSALPPQWTHRERSFAGAPTQEMSPVTTDAWGA